MFDITSILPHSLNFGAIYAAVLALIIVGSAWFNAEMWLNDYPPDVKAKFGPMSERTKRQRNWLTLLVFPVMLGGPLVAVWQLGEQVGDVGFAAAFLCVFIVLFLFNLVDLLLLDWLLFIVIQPRFTILPGTEGMAGYHDYAFHFRGFLIGLIFCLVGGIILGGVGALIW